MHKMRLKLCYTPWDSSRVLPQATFVLGPGSKTHASVVWCWDLVAKHISNPDVALF